MPDMLVPLYQLPPRPDLEKLRASGTVLRRANPFEISAVRDFVLANFSRGWADEASVTFARQPISTYLTLSEGKITGFASYEATRRGFFGPTGVAEEHRKHGLGSVLLLASLWGLFDLGYAYGIIGGAGPVDFYRKTVGAIPIPDSEPHISVGVYSDLLSQS